MTRLTDKDWDPEDPYSTSFDALGWATTWMTVSGSTQLPPLHECEEPGCIRKQDNDHHCLEHAA